MTSTRLIIHADDFGLTEGVNNGIVQAHKNGVLTSTSIIACGKAFTHAIELAKAHPTLDIGVHLTLTGERPLLPPEMIGSLVDGDGVLPEHISSFIGPLVMRRLSLGDIQRELRAQIQKILDHGVRVSHLDGHQHIHVLPGISRLVKGLAMEFSIPAVRYPCESIRAHMFKDNDAWGRLASLMVLNVFCKVSPLRSMRHPDRFAGFYFGGRLTEANLITTLSNLPSEGTVELMCHPGEEDTSGLYGHWNYRWREELDALTSMRAQNILAERNIELISYRDICGNGGIDYG
jgi:hopanoid biosynthesis associated protein HpnK